MNFIKKYMALLIPVGIVLCAVLFIVFTLMSGRTLADDMQAMVRQ